MITLKITLKKRRIMVVVPHVLIYV
jgi:hypothetical protein